MHKFNLIDEPWIPCVLPDGQTKEFGLSHVLKNAKEIVDIRGSTPLFAVAAMRLLLAILHRSIRIPKPKDMGKLMFSDFMKSGVEKYLNSNYDRFDLFDPKRPFYQVAGFETKEMDAISRLSLELACKSKPCLFSHRRDDDGFVMSFAECARRLIESQAYTTYVGGQPITTMFGKHPVYTKSHVCDSYHFLLKGGSLQETLALNLLSQDFCRTSENDLPAWERPASKKLGKRLPTGHVDMLTFQSKILRILPEENGCKLMCQAPGWGLDKGPDRHDMFFAKYVKRDGSISPLFPVLNAPWTAIPMAFSMRNEEDLRPAPFRQVATIVASGMLPKHLRCSMTALYLNEQGSDAMDWISLEFDFPSRLLISSKNADACLTAVEMARSTAWAMNNGGSQSDDEEHSVTSEFWAELQRPYMSLLMADSPNLDDWEETILNAAETTIGRTLGPAKIGVKRAIFESLMKKRRANETNVLDQKGAVAG